MKDVRTGILLAAVAALFSALLVAPASAVVQVAGNPFDLTSGFYVDPNSNPAVWVRDHGGDARAARIRDAIASKAGARWFGNWSGNIGTATGAYVGAADNADKLPILVAYNIPGRDCGGHSGGGAGSPAAYRTWIA